MAPHTFIVDLQLIFGNAYYQRYHGIGYEQRSRCCLFAYGDRYSGPY